MSTVTAWKLLGITRVIACTAILGIVTAASAQIQHWEYATLDFHDTYGPSWTAPDVQILFSEDLDELISGVEAEYGSLPPCPQRIGGPCITRTRITHLLNLVGQEGWRLVATNRFQGSEWYIFERPVDAPIGDVNQ